jgi:hypothetical protein
MGETCIAPFELTSCVPVDSSCGCPAGGYFYDETQCCLLTAKGPGVCAGIGGGGCSSQTCDCINCPPAAPTCIEEPWGVTCTTQ